MFPQPSSVAPVLGGQQFFRLNTLLRSPGDIYESEVGSLALVVGPDSDIANYLITYFDPNSDTMVSQLIVSPDRGTIGRIDARNETSYPGPGSRRGRILISIADIYDRGVAPTGYSALNDSIAYETPVVDVIQYFVNPPSLTPQRSDRVFRYQYLAPGTNPGASAWLILPCYGRKSGFFTFQNEGVGGVTVNIIAMRFGTTQGSGGVQQVQLSTQAVAAAGQHRYVFNSSVSGLWDIFAIELVGYIGESMPMTITLSDDAL